MATIINPVIPGMAPDPSILRVGERYFIANSTFHWTPGIQIFESADLARWTLRGQVLTHGEVDLRGTNTPAGIWAPHLSHDPQTGWYWIVYSHMVNMAGREFCVDTYTMWASSIDGPWSDPLYVTSIGFDPALFHDGGKHYTFDDGTARITVEIDRKIFQVAVDADTEVELIGELERGRRKIEFDVDEIRVR